MTAKALSALDIEVGKHIASSNYVAGVSGWSIDGAGDAEFNDGTFRGTVSAEAIVASTSLTADNLSILGGVMSLSAPSANEAIIDGPNALTVTSGVTLQLDSLTISIGDSTSTQIGFFGSAGTSQPTVTGAGDARLTDLLGKLDALGLINDQTT